MASDVFSPWELGPGMVAQNRVVLAPMSNQQSRPDGTLAEDESRRFE